MRYFATLILLALLWSNMSAQSTYYYKLTKKVKDGVPNTNVSGGQFITFTDKACYESDRKGFSVEHGRLDYKYSDGGIKTYVGGSYWGNHAVFLFKSDLSALNVKTEDGEIYVYKRSLAPSDATTCSLIRKTSSGSGVYVPPIYPTYSVQPTNPVSGNSGNGGTTSSTSSSRTTTRDQKTRHTCPLCNGTGKWERNDGSIPLYGGTNYKVRCNECGLEHYRSTNHRHVTCPQCHGRGYKEY